MMPREKEGYRPAIADILEWTGGKRHLSQKDVAEYLGVSTRTVKRRGIGREGIEAPQLARMLCR